MTQPMVVDPPTDALDTVLKLLNERFPILVRVDGTPVRDRVQLARRELVGDQLDLQIVTYRGRQLRFSGIQQVQLDVVERDRQGVPITYEVRLETTKGAQNLHFVA